MVNVLPKVAIPRFRPLSISPSKESAGHASGGSSGTSTNSSPGKAAPQDNAALYLATGSPVALRRMTDEEKDSALQTLRAQADELEKQLGGDDPQQIVKDHIRLLHEYNEVKDVTQSLLGKLANIDGVTIKAMHERYDLPMDS